MDVKKGSVTACEFAIHSWKNVLPQRLALETHTPALKVRLSPYSLVPLKQSQTHTHTCTRTHSHTHTHTHKHSLTRSLTRHQHRSSRAWLKRCSPCLHRSHQGLPAICWIGRSSGASGSSPSSQSESGALSTRTLTHTVKCSCLSL